MRLTLKKKMIAYLLPATMLIFGGTITFLAAKAVNRLVGYANEISDTKAKEHANLLKSEFNLDANICRGVQQSISSFHLQDYDVVYPMYKNLLQDVAKGNPQFTSFWLSLEIKDIDPSYKKNHGRVRFNYVRNNFGALKEGIDTLELDGDNTGGIYYRIKQDKQEFATEPYWYTYAGTTEQILETSYCVPIVVNGTFTGLVGADVKLSRFDEMVKDIEVPGGGYAFLVSNKGVFISHPEEDIIGEKFNEDFSEVIKDNRVLDRIEKGDSFSYIDFDFGLDKECYYAYAPVTIGNTDTPMSLGICYPNDYIKNQITRILSLAIFIGLLGLSLITIIVVFIARNITKPINKTTEVLGKLAEGDVEDSEELKIKSGDEIEEMANSVNKAIAGIKRTAEFARVIGQGQLNADFEHLGEKDILGNSLLEMRKNLVQAEEEEIKRKEEDQKQNWATEGLAKFGDILRQSTNIEELSFNIISNLVDYVEAVQGGLFVKNHDDYDEVFFELKGAVAYDRQKTMESSFKVGESLVGRCAYESLTIYMEEVPNEYVKITSGLGDANPRSILLVPCILNDEVFAIIELVSFSKFEPYQINFIEKMGESIASTISNAKVNERTNKLLEQSKMQGEELAAQEEEMRQNMEELQATQEEVNRIRDEEREKNIILTKEIEELKARLGEE